ncbi:MAG: hypothetical protein ACOY91_11005 [Pseudomonadota bacterium]
MTADISEGPCVRLKKGVNGHQASQSLSDAKDAASTRGGRHGIVEVRRISTSLINNIATLTRAPKLLVTQAILIIGN